MRWRWRGKKAGLDPVGYAAAEDDRAGCIEGAEARSGDGGDRGRGIHGTVAKERGALGAGRSLRIPGQIGVGTGPGERGVAGGARAHRAPVEAGSPGGETGKVRVGVSRAGACPAWSSVRHWIGAYFS